MTEDDEGQPPRDVAPGDAEANLLARQGAEGELLKARRGRRGVSPGTAAAPADVAAHTPMMQQYL